MAMAVSCHWLLLGCPSLFSLNDWKVAALSFLECLEWHAKQLQWNFAHAPPVLEGLRCSGHWPMGMQICFARIYDAVPLLLLPDEMMFCVILSISGRANASSHYFTKVECSLPL
jgi:hypothetical protein